MKRLFGRERTATGGGGHDVDGPNGPHAREPHPPEPPPPPADGEYYTLDELLAPHPNLLPSLERPRVDIEFTPVPEDARTALEPDGMEARASKLGGVPFSPAGYAWPTDRDGRRLHFVAQVNFAEAPPLRGPGLPAGFPTEGLLQVFEHDFGSGAEEDAGCVKYFTAEEARAPHVPYPDDIPFPEYPASSVERLSRVSFSAGTSAGATDDVVFRAGFAAAGVDHDGWAGDRYADALDELYDRFYSTDGFGPSGHRIGGYAGFTQADPREGQDIPDVHVLQIGSDDHVMFGDAGIAHVFIPTDAIAAGDWSRAYYIRDCY